MSIARKASQRTTLTIAASVAAVGLLAGCGGSEDPSPTDGGTNGDAPGLAESQALVDGWISETGTYEEPPVEGGPPAAAGKKIWIISCGESSSSCKRATTGATDAIEAIGWESTLFDTKGDYSAAATGIRQAIAAKADGIFSYFIDCSYMKEPLQEAMDAGIPVVQAEGADCSDADPSAPSLFAWSVTYTEGSILEWLESWGQAQAAYLIVNGQGQGNSLFVADNEALPTQVLTASYEEQMATCTGCESKVVAYSFAQQYEGLEQEIGSELLKNPNLTQVGVAYDGILQAGVSQAIQQAQQTGTELAVMAGEGQAPTIELVRQGVITAGVGLDNEAEAWSGIDALNRIFNDVEPVSSGIGIQIYDADHNLPESGAYVSPIDYKSVYLAAWGVG